MATRVSFGLLLSGYLSACVVGTVKQEEKPIPIGSDNQDDEPASEDEEPEPSDSDASAPDATSDHMPAVLLNEFNTGEEPGWWLYNKQPKSTTTFGVPDPMARDNAVMALVLPGDPARMAMDGVGQDFLTEARHKSLMHYGTYRVRLRPPECAQNEGVTTEVWLFHKDTADMNRNGIADSTWFNITLICGVPTIELYTTVDDDRTTHKFVWMARTINTETGAYTETVTDSSYDQVIKGSAADLKIPNFPDPNVYYELGFEWHPKKVKFFLSAGGREITIWDVPGEKYVPYLPANFGIEIEHFPSNTNWADRARDQTNQDYPAHDAVLRVDWFRYQSD